MDKSLIALIFLIPTLALAQTHTMPGSNVVPSGASLTINSGGSITAAAGSTVTGFGGGAVSLTATTPIIVTPSPITGTGVISLNATSKSNWDTAFTQMLQWDGGATNLVAATGRTSLGLGTAATTNATAYEVPLTFSTGLTRTTNTVTVNTSQNIATLSNLTTNGFVKTGGAVGTLSVDTATYQASNANLTSWAAITRASGIDTFATTPSSANLSTALTDETGTGGAAVFASSPTITTPSFTTGFTIGGAAASGKIIVGNGTNFVASTPTYPNAATPTALKWMRADGTNWIASTSTLAEGAVTAGKMLQSDGTNWTASTPIYPTTVGTSGYGVTSNGSTGYTAYPTQLVSSSTATVSAGYAADTYLAGSTITVAAGDFKVGGQYHCVFDMTKTGAGAATPIITVRAGTAGTTADAAICTLTFSVGTAVIDSGMFEVYVVFRTVGSGTTAVFQAIGTLQHQGGVTGLVSKNSDYASSTSSGFNSTTQTKLGLSFNGGTSFAGTNLLVQAQLEQP